MARFDHILKTDNNPSSHDFEFLSKNIMNSDSY